MTPTSFRIVSLPRVEKDPAQHDQEAIVLAHKFREFRLYALKTAPGAYAASYEEESQRGLDQTFERLTNEKAKQFVVLEQGGTNENVEATEATPEDLIKRDWLGFIVILGPQDFEMASVSAKADPFSQMTASATGQHGPGLQGTTSHLPQDLHYHLNGVFVHPKARGTGQGMALIRTALNKAAVESRELGRGFVCTIIVDKWNSPARKLYERAGFIVVAEEIYVQRPRELIKGGSMTTERVALRMELRRDLA